MLALRTLSGQGLVYLDQVSSSTTSSFLAITSHAKKDKGKGRQQKPRCGTASDGYEQDPPDGSYGLIDKKGLVWREKKKVHHLVYQELSSGGRQEDFGVGAGTLEKCVCLRPAHAWAGGNPHVREIQHRLAREGKKGNGQGIGNRGLLDLMGALPFGVGP